MTSADFLIRESITTGEDHDAHVDQEVNVRGPSIPKPTISERQRLFIERWVRNKADTPYQIIERCNIVLMTADGISNADVGRSLDVDRQRVRRWRGRWIAAQEQLAAAEAKGAEDKDLRLLILDVLCDEPRSGRPARITTEQIAQITSVACEPPAESGRPVTHWTPPELADEIQKRGIVDSISPRHVDRLLKRGAYVRTRPVTG